MWKAMMFAFGAFLFASLHIVDAAETKQPNIVFVLADDYGYNDIGYHGSEIKTPNLDKLSACGVRLENYYVQPVCSPSRTTFMSGRYTIHNGLQHRNIHSKQPNALPLTYPTLADKLKESGYKTHMIGKWHLGFYKPKFLPLNRGFDTFYGFLLGAQDYYTHENKDFLDLRDQNEPVRNQNGHYSTHLFTSKAIERINNHDTSKPFFLYMAYQAVHGPNQVPKHYLKPYKKIKVPNRKIFAGMVSAMDEGIKNITDALRAKGMWKNTVFVFSSDNGGTPYIGGNNYPLRGKKGSHFEGGVRANGFVVAPNLKTARTTSNALIHISDWYPTFVGLAGGSFNDTEYLDGHDQWDAISKGTTSPRTEILYNIDPLTFKLGDKLYGNTFDTRIRAALRSGDWKIITGYSGEGKWFKPEKIYIENKLKKKEKINSSTKNLWLFNVKDDPTERNDLSGENPTKVAEMLNKLLAYSKTAIDPYYPPEDPRATPRPGGVWGPWLADDES